MSIVMWTDTWKPDSFYDKIVANKRRGLHTLCLLGRRCISFFFVSLCNSRKILCYIYFSESLKDTNRWSAAYVSLNFMLTKQLNIACFVKKLMT